MRIGPLELTWGTKALPRTLSGVDSRGGWWPIIREAVSGDWQSSVTVEIADVLTYSPIYACITLISNDIAKMTPLLQRWNESQRIYEEYENAAHSPVLRKPNHYQSWQQFIESWLIVKLIHGNAYILKERDNRRVVRAMYVLDATRVRPLVSDHGDVFYQLQNDNLSGLMDAVTVPASEIIHDRMATLYHPLVGVSPISATGVPAVEALRIQENSANFFGSGSQPGSILSADGHITPETAARIKSYIDNNFTGSNVGKTLVVGDGLKYAQTSMKATDAQLIEQLKWTAEDACTAFGVPPYKINVGPPPNYNNIEALDVQYYSQCLQRHVVSIQNGLGFGLEILPDKVEGFRLRIKLNEDDLFEMDTATKVTAAAEGIRAGFLAPNEARRRFGLPPVEGGDSPYLQQQDFSLEALAERDEAQAAAPASPTAPVTPPAEESDEDATRRFAARVLKHAAAQARANATRMPDAA
jgi:HK97 family phage portal protein